MLKLFCIFFFITILLPAESNIQHNNTYPFQRKLWTFWDSEYGFFPIMAKLSIEKMGIIAKRHNFTFVCLNRKNLKDYIENYQEVIFKVRQKSVQLGSTFDADLVRIVILAQQGGIWVDSSTVFPDDLKELQNIMSQKYQNVITNRFSEQPEVLLFYFVNCQNRVQHRIIHPKNASKKILYNEYPNHEMWAFVAKKNSTLMRQIQKTYTEFTVQQFQIIHHKFIAQDIYINKIDNSWAYFYGNMAMIYVLQKRQAQLDKNLTLFGQRQYVNEYYKLWSMHSQIGPLMTIREDIFYYDAIFLYSKKQLEEKGIHLNFFLKYTGYGRCIISQYIDAMRVAFQDRSLTFEKFMESKPTKQNCDNIKFVVEGSIMDNLLKETSIIEQFNVKIITKQQNKVWEEYCSKIETIPQKLYNRYVKDGFLNSYKHSISASDRYHRAKAEQILAYDKLDQMSWKQWISVQLKANQFLFVDFSKNVFWTSILYFSFLTLFKILKRKIKNSFAVQQTMNIQFQSSKSILKTYKEIMSEKLSSEQKSANNKRNLIRKLMFLILLMNIHMYVEIDIFGGLQQPYVILACVCITFLSQAFIEKNISELKKNSQFQIDIETEYNYFFLFINFIATYMTLVYVRRHRYILNYCNFVIGLAGPCLLKLKKELQIQEKDTQKLYSWQQNKHRIISVIFLAGITINPNVRFLAGENGYYLKYIIVIPLVYVMVIYFRLLKKCYSKKIWFSLFQLISIAIVCYFLNLDYYQRRHIVHQETRTGYVFRIIFFFAIIYTQMIGKRKMRRLRQYFSEKIIWLLFFGPIFYELAIGKICRRMVEYSWDALRIAAYTEHFALFAYNVFLIALIFVICKNPKENDLNQDDMQEKQAIYY